MHFLAVGYKHHYPFLTWLVDVYSLDKTRRYVEKQKCLDLVQWATENQFMKDLKKAKPKRYDQLISAMKSYGNRILPGLKFTPNTKIYDDIKAIADYVCAMPSVIETLIKDNKTAATPPFCVCYYLLL